MLGDTAAGSGADLGDLAFIFGKIRAAGKLTGETLQQLQERAINVAPVLAQQFGVSEAAIRDLVSSGKVGFDDVAQAFATMTSEGGQFNNLMEKQSKTLGGLISTIRDNLAAVAREVGQALLNGRLCCVITCRSHGT